MKKILKPHNVENSRGQSPKARVRWTRDFIDRGVGSARKTIFHALIAVMATALTLPMSGEILAQASNYPDKPVTIVVPSPAGGGTDLVTRSLANVLSKKWKQPVIVQNRPGADGWVGTQSVLLAPADGYTMLMTVNQLLLWKWTMPSAKMDLLKDFQMISQIQTSPMVFGIPTSIPAKTFNEFIAWCQAPGQNCTWGSATTNGLLTGKQIPGLDKATYVPYKGTAPMVNDLLGGHISMGITSVSAGLPHLNGDKLRFLAVSSRERFPLMPDVPTLLEMGYGVSGETWYGLMVPRATPKPVFESIAAAVKSASEDVALIASIKSSGGHPVFNSPDEFTAAVKAQLDNLETVVAKYPISGR